MSTIVRLGPEYIPDPTKGKPIANGSIYIGEPDLDPEIVLNQIQVYAQQEDGDVVTISQPIGTGAGGVPLLDGSPVTLLVNEAYSLKVLDSLGVQVYYVPTNFAQNVSALVFLSDYGCDLAAAITDIGSTETTLMIDCAAVISDGVTVTVLKTTTLDFIRGGSVDGISGGSVESLSINGPIIADPVQIFGENLKVKGLPEITECFPEWWGAYANGVTDSAPAINRALLDFGWRGIPLKFGVGTYSIETYLTLDDQCQLIGVSREATIIKPSDPTFNFCILAQGSGPGTPISLTADGDIKDTVVSVSDSATFSEYDIVLMESEQIVAKVDASTPRVMAEFVRIKSISGNDLTLFEPLYYEYTTAESSTATPVDTIQNVVIRDLHILRDRDASGAQGAPYTYGIDFRYVENGVVESVKITETTYHGIEIKDCYNTRISDLVTLNTEWPGNGVSYGIQIGGSRDTLVENAYIEGARHCISVGGLMMALGVRVVDSVLVGNADDNYAADSHVGAEIVFDNCRIIGGAVLGPPSATLSNCEIISNGTQACIAVRGIAVDPRFGRELTIDNCKITWNGTDSTTNRGPIYLTFADDTENSTFIMTDTKIWNYGQGINFQVPFFSATVDGCTIKSQEDTFPPVPGDFYPYLKFGQAKILKVTNNYIEGGIRRQSGTLGMTSALIANNIIYNSVGSGIYVLAETGASEGDVVIKGNMIYEAADDGIVVASLNRAVIEGNLVVQTHVAAAAPHYGIRVANIIEDLSVLNNICLTESVPYFNPSGFILKEHVAGNNFQSEGVVLNGVGAGVTNGTTSGFARTTATINYKTTGTVSAKNSVDDVWDLTGFSTGAAEYAKVVLSLDAAGAGWAYIGDVAASQALAEMPRAVYPRCIVGIVELPNNYAGGSLAGYVFYDVIGSFGE